MIKISERLLDKYTLAITFSKGEFSHEDRVISIRGKSEEEIFQEKIKLVNDLDYCNLMFKDSKKALIKAYSQVDERFINLYNELYDDTTEVYHYVLTKDEKEHLDEALKNYRIQNS